MHGTGTTGGILRLELVGIYVAGATGESLGLQLVGVYGEGH